MKKIIALLLVVVLAASCLAGCAKTPAATTDELQKAETPAAAETKEDASSSEGKSEITGKLTYISWMTKGEDEAIINAFMEEYPGVEVEIRTIDGTNYGADILTLCASGDVPDVLLTKPTYLADLVDQGYIAPIDGFKGVDTQTSEAVNEVCSRNGSLYLYAINGGLGNFFIYYNKDIFEKYNLSVPTTPEELDAICETLKNAGETPMIAAAGDTWNAAYFAYGAYFEALQNLGGPVQAEIALLEGTAKPSDVYGPMLQRLADYKAKGYLSEGGLSMGWEAGAQYFCEGNGAMFATGNWFPGSGPVAENPDFKFGCFDTPQTPLNGTYLDYLSIDRAIGISAKTEYPEAAQALVEFFIREDNLSNYLTSQGLTGVNITVPTNPVFDDINTLLTGEGYTLSPKVLLGDMPTGWNSSTSQYFADACAGSDPDELAQKLDDEFAAFIAGIDVQPIIDSLK